MSQLARELMDYKRFLTQLRKKLLLVHYYWATRVVETPYFGHIYSAGQTSSDRVEAMNALLQNEIARNGMKEYTIVEVGSWAGQSAINWARQLKKLGVDGEVLCIDPWEEYDGISGQMRQALISGEIYRLFLHNVKASGCDDVIWHLRGSSSTHLNRLCDGYCDMVYIDGDHRYPYVKSDIEQALRVVKDGGVVCGDDLELEVDELPGWVDIDRVRNSYREIPEYGNVGAHLGVTVAVWDTVGRNVSNCNGFWAIRKVNGMASHLREQ